MLMKKERDGRIVGKPAMWRATPDGESALGPHSGVVVNTAGNNFLVRGKSD
jgi:hypothetical protein